MQAGSLAKPDLWQKAILLLDMTKGPRLVTSLVTGSLCEKDCV